ncbi:MAG: 23S rRNA (uracil(1939)-C(5))-methyltransferase RlmD [bacterium]
MIKKDDILELQIESYAFEGKGIAKIDLPTEPGSEETGKKFVIFVNGSYPGDVVKAKIVKKRNSYADAVVIEIVSASEQRTSAPCKYFGTCGGCKQQNLNYSAQLQHKQDQVKDIFERLGALKGFTMESIEESKEIFRYRNKMEFSFADKRWLTKDEIGNDEIIDRNFALGLHIPRIFDKVLDIDECYLQPEVCDGILNFTRDFFKEKNSTIYSTKTHVGYLRNLIIRKSTHTNDLMVNIVTSAEDEEMMNELTSLITKQFPGISTVINNINQKKSQVAVGDYEKVFYGAGFNYDLIGKYKFRISANSFFQTNTLQAEKLYQCALDYAELKGDEIVYDLYSGAGTIAIFISKHAKKIYGFESVAPAVEDGLTNLRLNGINNVEFIKADLNKSFLPIIKESNISKPDVIIADPPRSGMNPKTVNDILSLSPQKIVYVSCNPATQVRDIKLLADANYKLVKIRPVDMFPHTYHIENVALLVRI